jgi:cytochrome c55X
LRGGDLIHLPAAGIEYVMRSYYLLLCACLPVGAMTADTPSSARQDELRNLLLQDCGSCHGMRLTGGLGPALTPQALHGKPRELLIATVSDGRPNTPMPPWKPLLSQSDIAWLVDYLISGENRP